MILSPRFSVAPHPLTLVARESHDPAGDDDDDEDQDGNDIELGNFCETTH